MDLKKQIRVALGLDTEEDLQLSFQAKTEDGTIVVSTAEELENGVDISVLTEDGTTIKLPPGTYKLDTGVSFRVEEEGIVAEVMESETEEEIEAEDDKEEMAEEKDGYEEESEAEETDWAKTYEEMKEKVQNLEDAIADIKKQIGESGDVEEMAEETTEETTVPSKNPRTKTTKTTEVVEFNAEEEIEKLKAENEKLKTELSETPADSPINTNKFSSEKSVLSRKDYNKLSRQEKFLYNLNK